MADDNDWEGGEPPPLDKAPKESPRPGPGLRLRRSRRRGEDYDEIEVDAQGWSALLVVGVALLFAFVLVAWFIAR